MKANLSKLRIIANVHRNCARTIALAAIAAAAALPAVAAVKSWNSGAGVFQTAASWSPVGVPAAGDDVHIGNLASAENATVFLNASTTVASLALTDAMRLETEIRTLTVNGPLTITGRPAVGGGFTASRLIVDGVDGSALNAQSITLSDGGELRLDQAYGSASGLINIDANSTLEGDGGLTLSGNGPKVLSNDGVIDPWPWGLRLTQIGNGLIDLDGTSGDGHISLTTDNGSIDRTDSLTIIGTSLADAFSSTIYMRGRAKLDMDLSGGWTADASSLIDVSEYAGDVEPALITGGAVTLGGTLDIDFDTDIDAPATIAATAQIDVGSNKILDFLGPTTVLGGTLSTTSNEVAGGVIQFSGPTTWTGTTNIDGIARQFGDATVSGTATINAGVFDMDGGGADWQITGNLTVNADAIDELEFPNAFNTNMTIGGNLFSRLTVNLSQLEYWAMDGHLTIIGDPALYTTRLAGSQMYLWETFELTGGRAHIACDVFFGSGTSTTIPAGASLRLGGATTVGLAEFSGSGELRNAASGNLNLFSGASLGDIGVLNEGTFGVSSYAGIASVARFENAPSAAMAVNIAGYAAGDEHDQLVISPGPAILAGDLRVSHDDLLVEAFEPQIGDEFTIITAVGGVNGEFNANPTSCAAGHTFHWTVLYGANDVRLRLDAVSECCPPDVSGDGNIDLTDLAILLSNFGLGSNATQPMGDIDFDGDVDLTDLAMLLSQFGTACT